MPASPTTSTCAIAGPERLAAALIVLDAQALAFGNNYTFDTFLGKLDLLGWVEPLGDCEKLAESAEVYPVADLKVQVIGLDDLIRIKEHVGRSKDRDSLWQLQAIRKIRQEQSGQGQK